MDRWRFKLDTNLPGELAQIADWINTAEEVLTREINFDPMKSSPEENIDRFNQLNEEYTAIFNDKERMVSSFQRIKRDPTVVNKQISHEHLTHLTERLDSIIRTHEEYGRFLDFEEIRWKVQSYISQLEILATILNQKQGDLNQTESLYSEYKVCTTKN